MRNEVYIQHYAAAIGMIVNYDKQWNFTLFDALLQQQARQQVSINHHTNLIRSIAPFKETHENTEHTTPLPTLQPIFSCETLTKNMFTQSWSKV